jgi:hypothetical protein
LLGGADLGQPVFFVVVCPWDVMELAALEESVELLYVEAIGGHVGVLGVPFPGDLVYHQVGVSVTEDSPYANLLGHLEPMHQGFVFRDIV